MSDAPDAQAVDHVEPGGAGDSPAMRLAYAVFGAITADLGCIIGAAGFVLLIVLSVVFATQLTPCTTAGGIPCSP